MKILFGLLLALLESSVITAAAKYHNGSEDKSCRARAWVRAPDLEPGQVVQGDVKVELDGACNEVLSYTLRLRFSERSWVKTRREGVQIPERPTSTRYANYSVDPLSANSPVSMGSDTWPYPGGNSSAWDEYRRVINDPSSWLVREEERIGFETKYNIRDGKHISHDVVESFAILVPSTVYPPAFEPFPMQLFAINNLDDAGAEHIYAYAVDVAFVNGTIIEVPAGYTSFDAPTVIMPFPETLNVTVSRPSVLMHANSVASEVVRPEDVDMFTLEVTFPHGRHLEQGSINNITIVSHQEGPGIERPDRISRLNLQFSSKRHWAASFAADNKTAEVLGGKGMRIHRSQLRPTGALTTNSQMLCSSPHSNNDLRNPRFPQDETIPNGTMFSTQPITAQLYVPEYFYPHFDTHFETTESQLQIHMELHNVSVSHEEDTEEYDWIPTTRQSTNRRILAFSAKIPIVVHSKEADLAKSSITQVHYLSPEARAPVFVAPTSVQNLLQISMDERDALSPRAQPSFIIREGSDVVVGRYFMWGKQQPELHYVGNTWLRKVVSRRKENKEEKQASVLRVQS